MEEIDGIHLPEQWRDWTITERIGCGKWGAVYAIRRERQGRAAEAALKVVSIPEEGDGGCDGGPAFGEYRMTKERAVREYRVMEKLRGHECIVRADEMILQHNEEKACGELYIRMELLTHMCLCEDSRQLEEQVIRLGMDICSALVYCEKNNIVHRDIKPWNIYVSGDGRYKLGDFGSAAELGEDDEIWVGTPNFTAPEVHRGDPYGHKADVYGLGMVMYWMLNKGRLPFLPLPPAQIDDGMEKAARMRRIGGEAFAEPVNGSNGLRGVVMKAGAFDPQVRYASASDMLAELEKLQQPEDEIKETEQSLYQYRKGKLGTMTGSTEQKRNPTDGIFGTEKDRKEKEREAQERRQKEEAEEAERARRQKELEALQREKEEQEQKKKEEKKRRETEEKQKRRRILIAILCGILALRLVLFGITHCWFGHKWIAATCTSAQTCYTCGKTQGSAPGHSFAPATSTVPKTCTVCGATEGTVLEHIHSWTAATCTEPEICTSCGETRGTAAEHQWNEATYDAPQTCWACGLTVGSALDKPSIRSTPETGMIAAGKFHSAYLYSDGTVFAVGSGKLSEDGNRGSRLDVSSWTEIVAISASSHTVGLKADGTVVAVGVNEYGQCNVDQWENIIAIDAGDHHTVGLREDGTVVAVGNNNYGQCDVSEWRNIISVGASEETTYALTSKGRVLSAGKKNWGSSWSDIVAISVGTYHIVGLKSDGTVVQAGGCDNWDKGTENWTGIVAISAGSAHTVGLRADGTVVACGSETSDKGQCEVNTWFDIIQISAGMYHTLGLRADGTIVAAGSNGYHQLDIAN